MGNLCQANTNDPTVYHNREKTIMNYMSIMHVDMKMTPNIKELMISKNFSLLHRRIQRAFLMENMRIRIIMSTKCSRSPYKILW